LSNLTILPGFTRLAINSQVMLSVQEQIAGNINEVFLWKLSDESIAVFGNGETTSSSSATPIILGKKLGNVTLTVSYQYKDAEENNVSLSATKVIAVTWPGLSFSGLKPSDIVPVPTSPDLTQNPLNIQMANLRAHVAPCSFWEGAVRDYVVKEVKESDSGTKEYISDLGYVVSLADKNADPSIPDNWVGTVKPVGALKTMCILDAASNWSTPLAGRPFPPCNGAKPFKNDPSNTNASGTPDDNVGRCPFYSSDKVFKHVFDDALGFKKSGYTPKIAAAHVQELRILSDNWAQYANPKATFKSRFTIDPDIWAWTGFVKDENGDDIPTQIKVKKVSVNDEVNDIIIGAESVIDLGTLTNEGLPNYPTLIKELFASSSLMIDFPRNPPTNPFIVRNFTGNENEIEVYGHTSIGKSTLYAVNVTYATIRQYELGIIPAKMDIVDSPDGGLPSAAYIQFLQENVPDAVYTTTSAYDGSFVFGLDYSNSDLGEIDKENRIKLVYSKADDSYINKIRVYTPSASVSSNILYDTTHVKCRFLHGWTYQTSFNGNCNNTDSTFKEFDATLKVQLASGFESISSVMIASPDLGAIYATWKKSVIEAPVPFKQSYYLHRKSKSIEIQSVDITPLHTNREFIVRVMDLDASKLSYWNVTSASLLVGETGIPLDVVNHYNLEDYSNYELYGTQYKGVSYRGGYPLPANYLHLRLSPSVDSSSVAFLSNARISLSFDYLEHKDSSINPVSNSVDSDFRYPENVNLQVNVLENGYYSLSPSGGDYVDDGLSSFYTIGPNGELIPRDVPLKLPLVRTYTISGGDIPYRIRYIVFFTDEEGRVIGKKQSAILFGISVPTCADIEISYAWAGIYNSARLLPIFHRFCNWSGGASCYEHAGTPCGGTPTLTLRDAGPALYLSKICFDHGESYDRVWWPYYSCEIPSYDEPKNFGSFFSLVPTNGPVWNNKYLVGYDFFRDSTTSDSGYFFDCFFGTKYSIYTLSPGSVSFAGAWSGGTVIRAGDMRANTSDGVGTKSAGGWLWGTERERKVLYAGIDKAMNYLDIVTGYVSNIGTDGVSGLGYLTEPAGVDLNGIATEDFIHPFNQMRAVSIGGFPTEEYLIKEYTAIVNEQPVVISLRKCSSYWITGNLGGENWKWPLIEWWFDNNYQDGSTYMDCEGEIAPPNRGEQVPGKQISWLYLDKKVTPIQRSYSTVLALQGAGVSSGIISYLSALTLRAVVLEYPPDFQDYVSAGELFENLPPEKYFVVSYRPAEGTHTLYFKAPIYNSGGLILDGAEAKLGIDDAPKRRLTIEGSFIPSDEEPPYDDMELSDDIDRESFLASDVQDQFERNTESHKKRRGLMVRTPIDFNSLPYLVDNILNASTYTSIASVRGTYNYSICPKYGGDVSGDPCSKLFEIKEGAITTGTFRNFNTVMDTSVFDIIFNFSNPPAGTPQEKVWQPYIERIEVELFQGDTRLPEGTVKVIQPQIDVSLKRYGSSFEAVGTMYDPSALSDFFLLKLENINLNASSLKLSFSPPLGKSGYVIVSKVYVYARIQQDASEVITTYDRKYTPSFINKDDGITGIGPTASFITPVAALVNSAGHGSDAILTQDTYKGDARRFVNFGMTAVKRPILPTWPYHVLPGGDLVTSPFSSVFKGGRVVMDTPRDDAAVKGANGRDLHVDVTGIQDRFPPGGSPGPGESMQEDIYTYAKNLILQDTLVYDYFMHPDEESFFVNDLGVDATILPQNNVDISRCTISLSVPENLALFRGDTYKNYLGVPWQAPGVYVSQDRTGSCWCYVGKISKICGEPGGPEGEPSCTDRFMTMGYSGSRSYINDLSHIVRRFTNVLGYAFFMTWSDGLLSLWPELVGQPYVTPKNKDIFSDINPQGRSRHITITGDYVVPAGSPFYFWFDYSFQGQLG